MARHHLLETPVKDADRRSVGQYVRELVNTGAGMTGLRIGRIVRSGAHQYEVLWESGHRQRYPQGYAHTIENFADYRPKERDEIHQRIASYKKGTS